jgi:hypothetical protein
VLFRQFPSPNQSNANPVIPTRDPQFVAVLPQLLKTVPLRSACNFLGLSG